MSVEDAVKAYCELIRTDPGTLGRFQAEPAMKFLRDYIAEETGRSAEFVQAACVAAAATAVNVGGKYTRFAAKVPDFMGRPN